MALKKIFVSAIVLGVMATSGSASAALRSGIYTGLTAGGSMMRSKIDGKMQHDTTFVSTIALGLRVKNARFAAEIMMNTKADYKKADGNLTYEANGVAFQTYYDIPLRSIVRPFFNLGAGVYGSDIKGEPDVNTSNDKMMWNVGGGFTLAVSRSTSLDLGYRYVRFGKEKYKDGNKNDVSIETEAHQIYAGWRYVF